MRTTLQQLKLTLLPISLFAANAVPEQITLALDNQLFQASSAISPNRLLTPTIPPMLTHRACC
ncbi:hypothetical protein [Motilimonas sp. E26]|uniref:hypothetical protein n=1 Tax=Motilimonas sp. E26 TaxID=2865674 RepID=UPI001E51888E|nr:hypothetical protein [Motilimonas sp. E26]MCE0556306.1 hypothetical protein [Motilimonas sp. E26]